jgi:3-hydroxybutyryl-CoA dehydrogenase
MTEIKQVGVLGSGLMGSGIAQVAATAGYDTIVRDVSQQIWDKARTGMEKSLAKLVEKGKLSAADRDAALKRLRFTTTTADLKGCDILVEAVTEDLELKNALWKELDGLCGPATIFASNTSSLTIAAMAAATRRADRFVGLHFFNPVPLMPLVEVVRTVTTSEETFRRAFAFAKSLGKEPVAAKDNSGFIVNLLLVPYLLDAIRAVERGVGSVPDAARFRRAGHDVQDRRDHVHGVPRATLCSAAAPEAHGPRGDERSEEPQGLLRLCRRSAQGRRPGSLTRSHSHPPTKGPACSATTGLAFTRR